MMDHAAWAEQMKAAMALKCTSPERAAAALKSLARSAERQVKGGLTDWHVEQAIGLAAVILAESGDHPSAARLCRRNSRHLRAQLTYYVRALASSLAFEAFQLSACGQDKGARRVALEAMGYFEGSPDSSTTVRRLAKLLEGSAPRPRTAPKGPRAKKSS
jgi:hypothetical protein